MNKAFEKTIRFAGAAAAALLITACSQQARAKRHLERADTYFAQGDLARAEIEYLNAARIDQSNAHAIGRLGAIYFDQGSYARSIERLIYSHRVAPDDLEVQIRLARVYLTSGKPKEARDEAAQVMQRRPDDSTAPLVYAEASNTPESIAESRTTLQKFSATNPANASAVAALAVLSLRENNAAEAETLANKAVSTDPHSSSAYATLASVFLATKDIAKAEPALRTASELAPPRSIYKIQYARFKLTHGDAPGAVHSLEAIVAETPDFLTPQILLAEIALGNKDAAKAATLIAHVLGLDPTNPDALLLDARVKLVRGDAKAAIQVLESLASKIDRSAPIHYHLALAYLADNDGEKAAASLTRALSLAPDYSDATILLASINIQQGNPREAAFALRELMTRQPSLPQLRPLLADAYRSAGQWDDALAIYQALEKENPGDPQPPYLSGVIFLQTKRTAEAREAFGRALKAAPFLAPAVEQLVGLDLAENQIDAARARAEAFRDKFPTRYEPYLLIARVAIAAKASDEVEIALRKVIEINPDISVAYLLLARSYIESGRHADALANLETSLKHNPRDTAALMLSGMIHQQRDEFDPARDAYERVLAINPKFTPALNNVAYLYSEHYHDLPKAYEAANKARDLRPHDPYALDTFGWILCQKREFRWALSVLSESAAKLSTEPEVQYHLGTALYMVGNENEASSVLRHALELKKQFPGSDKAGLQLTILSIDPARAKASDVKVLEERLADSPDDPIALNRRAAIYERDGDLPHAKNAFERAATANPQNVDAQLVLARLYHDRLNDTARALELAKSVYKLAPDNGRVQLLLGKYVAQDGNDTWAAALLSEAAQKLPDDSDANLEAAVALYRLGRSDQALDFARKALTVAPVDSRVESAHHFIDTIALVDADSLTPGQAASLEKVPETAPEKLPAMFALARQAERSNELAAARETYEAVLRFAPQFSLAGKRLAILLARDPAQQKRALELANHARDSFPNDAELARTLAGLLFRQHEFSRAALLLRPITSDPGMDAESWYELGCCERELGRMAESKDAFTHALAAGLTGAPADEARRSIAP